MFGLDLRPRFLGTRKNKRIRSVPSVNRDERLLGLKTDLTGQLNLDRLSPRIRRRARSKRQL